MFQSAQAAARSSTPTAAAATRVPPPGPIRVSISNQAVLRRACACGGSHAESEPCDECRRAAVVQRRTNGVVPRAMPRAGVPAIVPQVVSTPGAALDPAISAQFGERLGTDLSGVRIHTGDHAHASTQAIGARAYTLGRHIVFARGEYAPQSASGRELLAHELVHVAQQRRLPASAFSGAAIRLGAPHDHSEHEADRVASTLTRGGVGAARTATTGLADDAGPVVRRTMLCSKPLEAPVAGWFARHAFVDDTGRNDCNGAGMVGNYAVTDLISGNFVRGCAVKTMASPDPRGKTTMGKPCYAKAGVTDLSKCLLAAYRAYNDPSLYSNVAVTVGAGVGAAAGGAGGAVGGALIGSIFGPIGAIAGGIIGGVIGALGGARAGAGVASRWNGPNSNTFAATLARACCADGTDSGLGWVPGWDDSPAPPCPGPTPGPGTSAGPGTTSSGPTSTPSSGPTSAPSASAPSSAGGATRTTPVPYSGGTAGTFSFSYQGGLPAAPTVGGKYMVTIGFFSAGTPCVADVEFEVVSIAGRTMNFQSTNTVPLNVAPVGQSPLVIQPHNGASLTR